MHTLASSVLQDYFQATNWSPLNQYGSITRASSHILDFAIPQGLNLSVGQHPTPAFASALTLLALQPSTATPLNGHVTYLASSADLHALSSSAQDVREVTQAFDVAHWPVRPELREDARPTWQGGHRVDRRDYLLYGRLYGPTPRMDALWIHRVSTTVQTLLSAITVPSPPMPSALSWQSEDQAPPPPPPPAPGSTSELEFRLQQDTGRWSSEYSYSLGDGMWGARALYNFGIPRGPPAAAAAVAEEQAPVNAASEAEAPFSVPDAPAEEDDSLASALRGRWSGGGEMYFSAQERSAGASLGLRFSTLPQDGGYPVQAPTVITATLNPIMGHLSTAYTVATSRKSAMSSRFDFNIYSYDAEVTVGGEWFQVREPPPDKAVLEPEPVGVLRLRASTTADVSLVWEGRVGSFLVGLGVHSDLWRATRGGGRLNPVKSAGLSLQYWR